MYFVTRSTDRSYQEYVVKTFDKDNESSYQREMSFLQAVTIARRAALIAQEQIGLDDEN